MPASPWESRRAGAESPRRPDASTEPTTGALVDVIAAPIHVAASADDAARADGWQLRPGRLVVIGAVVRRLVPYLIEATIIPTVLFWALLVVGDIRWALGGALAWAYGAVGRRLVRRQPVPGLLILATVGITVRTLVYVASSNAVIYFMQPILRTTLTGVVFAASVLLGRPLIARFAGDFCPLTADVRLRPGIHRLFQRLSILWATVNAVAAGASLVLLLTVPVAVFVPTAAVTGWLVTAIGVVVTVAAAVSTARREGLITALSPDGRLYAATVHPVTG